MILLQEHTRQIIDNMLERSPHAVLFGGPEGAGKAYAARYFATRVLGLKSDDALEAYPYFKVLTPLKSSIGIDQIRELQKFLQLKTPGQDAVRRVVILEDAHYMTAEAQNALLKILEEPPTDTMLILTAPATMQLKQTIYSRVQQVPMLPVSKVQATKYFATLPESDVAKAHAMSGGYAGLLSALLQDKDHPLAAEIKRAKQIIGSDRFERLTQVDELSKQRELLPRFLQACKIIGTAAIHSAAQRQNTAQLKQWHKALEAIYQAEAALPNSPNTKLLLTDLMLQL